MKRVVSVVTAAVLAAGIVACQPRDGVQAQDEGPRGMRLSPHVWEETVQLRDGRKVPCLVAHSGVDWIGFDCDWTAAK